MLSIKRERAKLRLNIDYIETKLIPDMEDHGKYTEDQFIWNTII